MRSIGHVSGLVLCCALVAPAHAEEPCGLRVAQLLASGQTDALAAMFNQPAEVAPMLSALVAQVGPLSALQPVAAPRFKDHRRLSVVPSAVQPSGPYTGHWVNGTSAQWGEVQVHIATQPAAACRVLAIHVDSAA
jgi:hypothetical protein